jgi:NAD(P)-dependent dehydrogenase (short-subunit alcohol dehydrogenase family)
MTAPLFHFAGKVIAITSGAVGIGYAAASLLVSQDAKVAITNVNTTALESAQDILQRCNDGGGITCIGVAMRERIEVESCIEDVVRQYEARESGGRDAEDINVERAEDFNYAIER